MKENAYTIANDVACSSSAISGSSIYGLYGPSEVHITKDYANKVYVDKIKMNLAPPIKNVIFNNPATIVYFEDGTKTVVKIMEGQEFDPDYGFMACLVKRTYGEDYHKLMWKHCWGGQEVRRAEKKQQNAQKKK